MTSSTTDNASNLISNNKAGAAPERHLEVRMQSEELNGCEDGGARRVPSAEARVREALFSRAAGMARLGWWDYDVATGRLQWSDEILETFGVSREAFSEKLDCFVEMVHPEDVARMLSGHGKSLATGEAVEMEYRVVRLDGEQRWVWDRGETIFDEEGNPARRTGVLIDITERKQAETRILKLSAAVEQAPHRVVITDRSGRIEYVNPAFEQATGYKPSEVIGRTPAVLKSGAHDREFYQELWQTILGGRTFQSEFINRRRNGELMFEEQTITPLRNEQGEISHFLSTGRDISQWKRAEGKLRESEERHRLLFEANPQPIWVFDLKTLEFLAVNPAAVAHYGYSEIEFLGMTLKDIRPKEDLEKFMEAVPGIQASLGRSASPILANFGETRHQTKDGRIITVEIRCHPIAYMGKAAAIVLPLDVTERKAAEQSLRDTEERFRQLAENVKEVFWIQDLSEDRLLYVSPSFDRVWGRSYESMKSSEDWLETIHREDREGVLEYLGRQKAEGCHEHTYRILRPDGEIRWIHNRAYPVAEEGKPLRIVGTSEDVTERVNGETALKLSEERFRLLSKATNDAVWDWDIPADRLWWNDGFETLFGFHRDEIESGVASWVNRVHPEDRERVKAETFGVIELEESNWEGEYRFMRSDGSFAWVLDRAHLIRNSEGKVVRMIGGMTDISARKEAEARATEQAMLLDIAHEGILVKDLSHKVLYWNKGAEGIFGWSAKEALGRSTLEMFHADAAALERATAVVRETGEWSGDLAARAKDGRELTISVRWTLVREKNGEPKAVFSIISDITEAKNIERQLLRAQRMESIGTLAGGIAHDLNNVLAPIMMAIEILGCEVKDPSGRALLATIESSARRGADLVKQVLGFARGVNGERIPINPLHVAKEIQRIARDTFPKNIQFEMAASRDTWWLRGDPTQLHQVLMNLCVNARDAMPNGGRIELGMQNVHLDEVFTAQHPQATKGPHVLITVSDTGTGIPKEHLDRIFEPFFTTKPQGHGTGLGLSTTMAIVKSHHGFIDVTTERGRGSTFKIYLPAASAAVGEGTAAAPAEVIKGKGEMVLVVDDEQSLREIAKATLERNGYRSLVASNGAEAVAAYARHPEVALALVDMTMPVMDGVATIVALRQLSPTLGIIASSGVASDDAAAKPVAAGADLFMAKPYTAEELLRSIKNTLKKEGKAKEAAHECSCA